MHERQAVREAIIAALVYKAQPSDPYPTAAGANVFKNRAAPLRGGELPSICVYTESEESAKWIEAPREIRHTAHVAIDVWVKADANVDDVLDDLCLQVEQCIDRDLSLGQTAWDTVPVSTEIGVKLDGERPIACAHLVYEIIYDVKARIPDAVDDFNTADIREVNVGENDDAGDNQPHDYVTNIHQP